MGRTPLLLGRRAPENPGHVRAHMLGMFGGVKDVVEHLISRAPVAQFRDTELKIV